MRRIGFGWIAGLVGIALVVSCGADEQQRASDDGTASIVLALTVVPLDVQCIEITVTGAQMRTQLFDVAPGQSTSITVQGLASGTVMISERAFSVPCSQVTATTAPTWVSVMPATTTLAPGQIADVSIVLRRPGQVRITNDFQDGQFVPSQSTIAFGTVVVGSTTFRDFNITNIGLTTATLPPLSIAGADASQFQVLVPPAAGNPCLVTTSLAPGVSCTTRVGFAPTSAGNKAATFNIGSIAAVALTGTAAATTPVFTPSTATLTFANTNVGATTTLDFNITNTGNAAGTLPPLNIAGADAGQFQVLVPPAAGNPCLATTSLTPGTLCTARVAFAPGSSGAKSATLNIGTVPAVALSGTGVAVMAVFNPSTTSLSFPATAVGVTTTLDFNITNTGNTTGTLPALAITGVDSTQFQVLVPPAAGNPCLATTSLAPGALCTTRVAFTPSSVGVKTAAFNIGASPAVALSGTGAAATFTPSTTAVSFGNVSVGATVNRTFTITNTGSVAGVLPVLSIAGTNANQFSVQTPGSAGNPCLAATSLAPGASCTTSASFFPTSPGAKSATFNIGATPAVALTGTGI